MSSQESHYQLLAGNKIARRIRASAEHQSRLSFGHRPANAPVARLSVTAAFGTDSGRHDPWYSRPARSRLAWLEPESCVLQNKEKKTPRRKALNDARALISDACTGSFSTDMAGPTSKEVKQTVTTAEAHGHLESRDMDAV